MKLRKFEMGDWDSFSGCDSLDPKIGEFAVTEIGLEAELKAKAVIILDDKRIQIHGIIEDEAENEFTLDKEFESSEFAKIFANGMEASYSEWFLINVLHFNIVYKTNYIKESK